MGLRTEPYICKRHGVTDYYTRPSTGQRYCRLCHSIKASAKYHKDNSTLARRYGITVEHYNELLNRQNNSCAICQSTKVDKGRYRRLCIDHNHTTGAIRGLLCNRCNRTLGMVNDSIPILSKMITYLYANREK